MFLLWLKAPGPDDVKEWGEKKQELREKRKKITAVFISTQEELDSADPYLHIRSSNKV